MKLSLLALREWIDYSEDAESLVQTLAGLGFPSDGIVTSGEALDQVVVGQILEMKPHPQADRLSLLKVDIGSKVLSIVCGAKNMKERDFVALATEGSVVPGKEGQPLTIKRSKIRGEESEGMCCSEEELALNDTSEGIWLLPFKEEERDLVLGKKVSEIFKWKDAILDIDITPNRGDAMSVRGLAREIAAAKDLRLKQPEILKFKSPSPDVHPKIESFEDAYAFAACLVKGVNVSKSSLGDGLWLRKMGTRSINNLVDITNRVLYELGHPIHFFDADKVDPTTIEIRRARAGEKLELLKGQVIELHSEDLVVADASGPLSLAGIMGGAASAVSDQTKNILIEVASFNPQRIRASAKRHQLSSESSMRFERGVPPYRIEEVMGRALALIKEKSSMESASGDKVVDSSIKPKMVLWTREKVERKLGKLSWSDDEIFSRLRLLEFGIEQKGSVTQLQFPWYRSDMDFLEDVMEDVARLMGYEKLERVALRSEESVKPLQDLQCEMKNAETLRSFLCGRGFDEVLHSSFIDDREESKLLVTGKSVKLKNPLNAERAALRRSLLMGLIERAKINASYGEENIKLFEIGPVFAADQAKSHYQQSPVSEIWSLGMVWYPRSADQKELWKNKENDPFYEFKGEVEALLATQGLQIVEGSRSFLHPKRQWGGAGQLHPSIQQSLDCVQPIYVGEWQISSKIEKKRYAKPAQFPSVDLDASFVISKSITHDALMKVLRSVKISPLESIKPYDVFESATIGKDKRSATYAMRYRKSDGTLELEEAKKAHQKLIEAAIQSFEPGAIALR